MVGLLALVVMMRMLMLRLMVMLLAQMVMMLHLQCPVVKMFPLSSIFQNISKGIIPNMRRWRHVVSDIGNKKRLCRLYLVDPLVMGMQGHLDAQCHCNMRPAVANTHQKNESA